MQKILSYVRRGVQDFSMIQEGDKIAVGLSGGKDSTTLLLALHELKRFYPIQFSLCAIAIDMGFEGVDFSPMQALCSTLDIPLTIHQSNIAHVVFEKRSERNPCSLCAKLRHGMLHAKAHTAGCHKVALGHHYDDAIETFFLCLFHEGRIDCFLPVTYLDRSNITLIRPLVYLPEKEIVRYAAKTNLPIVHNPCPANGCTQRQVMKDFIRQKSKHDPSFKKRIFGAITKGIAGWSKS